MSQVIQITAFVTAVFLAPIAATMLILAGY